MHCFSVFYKSKFSEKNTHYAGKILYIRQEKFIIYKH